MSRTHTLALIALGLVSVGGGYLGAQALDAEPSSRGDASPVAATPSQPDATVIVPRPDSTDPALPTSADLTRASLVSGPMTISYPVPEGWRESRPSSDMRKYKPAGYGEDTYVLRVKDVRSSRSTPQEWMERAEEELDAEHHLLRVVERTPTGFEFTYVSKDDHQARHGFRTWLDLDGDNAADVEFNINGRGVDALGAAALTQHLVRETRRD